MLSPKLWIKERYLWWRAFLPVIFAHKPLCERFQPHTVCIRNIYVCRSCLLLYLTLISTTLFFFWKQEIFYAYAFVWIIVLTVTMILSCPLWYARFPRSVQDIIRVGLGFSISNALWFCLTQQWLFVAYVIVIIFVSKMIYSALRANAHNNICQNCPEYHQPQPCSGFRFKKRKIRLYEKGLERFVFKLE